MLMSAAQIDMQLGAQYVYFLSQHNSKKNMAVRILALYT